MFEGAQLLERFGRSSGAGREAASSQQDVAPIDVQPDVNARRRSDAAGRVAAVRNRGAGKIQGVAACVADDLDDVRIRELVGSANGRQSVLISSEASSAAARRRRR